jgi:hypothetical protein
MGDDLVKENEHNLHRRNAYRLLAENEKERGQKKDQDLRGWITLRWILDPGSMDWIGLAHDREQWRLL